MPRSLAIETSGRIGSIAAAIDGRVLSEEQFPHGLQHAAQIIPIIDRMCRGQGWGPKDVEHLYVSVGPGSFTGLRIGITLAKTLSLATPVKIVAVPSVRVLVENAPAEARQVIIVLDAKRDQIFTAGFERGQGTGVRGQEWEEREPAHLDRLPGMLDRAPRPVHLLGEGIPYHEKFIPSGDCGIIVTPEEAWRARASVVAKLGYEMALRGEFTEPMMLKPVYIRIPEAEEKWQSLGG